MNPRALVISLLLLVSVADSARAGLEIIKARYGNTTSYHDVRGIISAYVRNNTLSFPVNARSMGGDPSPRQADYLWIVYEVNGHEFTESVQEGAVFTFKGVPGVKPVRPLLNLPLFKPPTPRTESLVIANGTPSGISVYSVDRFGQWVWVANLIKGETITVKGQLGQEWIATDNGGRVLGRDKISRGDNQLWVTEPGAHPPAGGFRGGEAWVRFENPGYRPLYLYQLDAAGRWNWIVTIESRGAYPASTRMGETWIATDTANRVVRQVIVAPGMSRVQLD